MPPKPSATAAATAATTRPAAAPLALSALPPALRPRRVALVALEGVLRRKQSLDLALDLDALEPGRDRAFARLLATTALRRLGQIDALLAQCLAEPLGRKAALVEDLLRLSVAHLLFLDGPPHAVIHSAVELCRALGCGGLDKLVNAVLRRLSRDGAALLAGQDPARLALPGWLWDSWCAAYGEDTTRAIIAVQLQEPPLDLTLRGERSLWADPLQGEPLLLSTLRRPAGGLIADLPGYEAGEWWVQDAAAALPVALFGSLPGQRIADLCAAPGGKTAQLACGGAEVIALDRSPARLKTAAQTLARLGLSVDLLPADACHWIPPAPLDGVLLDAPCSATGTLRRHPDAPWLKSPADLPRLMATQDRLLRAAVPMLRPGGTLVYCTCSLQPEEGAARIDALLAEGAPLRRRPVTPDDLGGWADAITPDGDLRCLPSHFAERGGMDGFFAARLERLS